MRPGDQQRRVTQGKASIEPGRVRAQIAQLRPDKYRWSRNEMVARWWLLLAVITFVAIGLAFLVRR